MSTPAPPASGLPAAALAPPAPPPGFFAALMRNLSGGLELLALRRLWPPRFVVSFDQIAALLALNLAVWALLDFVHSEPHSPLALDGLFGWACYLLIALTACAVTARVQSHAANTRALLVPALAVAPYVLTIFWLAQDLVSVNSHPWLSLIVAVLYLVCLTLRVLGAAFGRLRLAPAVVALLCLLASPWALALLNLDTRLWVAEETGAPPAAEDEADAEEIFYDQPARIAAAVARVVPAPPGKPAVYFVGFAGDGGQSVFKREALFAAEVFGARYGALDRALLLINDVEDRDTYPLASVAGLNQSLKVLAARMNPADDVLVLFLTSHGSEDGLEVSNGALPLAQLAPTDLREALDASGIRWRVVVLSACYAGVFIDELKSDTTAIITASDASHTSFGCQEDRELTWFGEAFLKDALPTAASLEEAFRKAASEIARREDSAHETHSNPQLYLGPLMRTKLAELPLGRPESGQHAYTVRR